MNRKIETDLFEILDLILCAEGYGFGDDVFYVSMFNMIRPVSDEEITSFAENLRSKDGYGQDDYDDAIEQLTDLRDQYSHQATP